MSTPESAPSAPTPVAKRATKKTARKKPARKSSQRNVARTTGPLHPAAERALQILTTVNQPMKLREVHAHVAYAPVRKKFETLRYHVNGLKARGLVSVERQKWSAVPGAKLPELPPEPVEELTPPPSVKAFPVPVTVRNSKVRKHNGHAQPAIIMSAQTPTEIVIDVSELYGKVKAIIGGNSITVIGKPPPT